MRQAMGIVYLPALHRLGQVRFYRLYRQCRLSGYRDKPENAFRTGLLKSNIRFCRHVAKSQHQNVADNRPKSPCRQYEVCLLQINPSDWIDLCQGVA